MSTQPARIMNMVLTEGARLMLLGVAVGLPVALAVNRVMSSRVFRIGTSDALTIAGSAVVMAAVTSIAGYLPAQRAARVDPMVALRSE